MLHIIIMLQVNQMKNFVNLRKKLLGDFNLLKVKIVVKTLNPK